MWNLGDACDECGYLYEPDGWRTAAARIRDGVTDFVAALKGNDHPDRRPAPDIWSPKEYGCHLRDVLLVQRERVLAARRTDRPSFDPMGRDERAGHDGYAKQALDDVARQLADTALLFANVLDRLETDEWDRTLMYNFPAREERSLRWVAVHTLHEVRHHLGDVRG
jgi:hypothetical protein